MWQEESEAKPNDECQRTKELRMLEIRNIDSSAWRRHSSSEADDNLLPLLLRHEGGEGWREEAVLMSLPLSPFVPHGERGLARRAASGRLAVRLKTSCSPRAGTRPTIIPRESTCVVGPVPSPGAFFNGLLDIFAPKHQRKSTSEGFCLPPFRHSDLSGLLALSSLRNTTLTPPSFGLLKRSSRPGAGWAGGIEDAASFFSPSGSSAERSAPWTSSAQ